jgi:hypothetical protein
MAGTGACPIGLSGETMHPENGDWCTGRGASRIQGMKRRRIWIALGAAAVVMALSRTQFEIRHTVDIDAPPERVWAAVVDFPGYAAWNSQLAYLGGTVELGGQLHLRLAAEGADPYEFKPTVSHLEENRRFAWIARTGLPRVFDGEHFFELERLPSGGTRLTNREEYRGVLSMIFQRLPMMKSAPRGFEKMNNELKRYIEAARS